MKRLIFLLAVISLVAFTMEAQKTTIPEKYTAVTINGVTTGTTTFIPIQGEWDVSLQLIPALGGVTGDSLDFSYIIYQSDSNDDAVWTALGTADTVSSTTDSDGIWTVSDFGGLRLKAIYTGISTDTITVTPYSVYKKHKNE
ncbi:hypothetical protein LCGC14_1043780 [marine sediment metagenome]|uniref:Uncharacterized protein n=1 Tax=marine sediment metagenome TaxID=412755 RepID=A0A0F9Q944_9ZZZZ